MNISGVVTDSDFLTFERQSEIKHELILNEIMPMGGASYKHSKILINLVSLLYSIFNNTNEFEVIGTDMRVSNPLNNSYCYPDVIVLDSEPKFLDDAFDTLLNPVFIAEILSSSTQSVDLTLKFDIYKSIPSIQEYLIVDQNKPFVKLYKKISLNHWELFEFEKLSESITILDNKFQVQMSEIYRKVI